MKKRYTILIISIILFSVALAFPAVYTQNSEMYGLACFMLGWADLTGDGTAWLANPLFFIAGFFLLIKQVKISIVFSFFAICMSLYYLSAETITVNEAGTKSPIVSYGPGYYLWITSFLSLLIGSVIILRSSQKAPAERIS
ncbi:hypothetical protein CEY12_16515 [Chryseobacterium sp. T16E-39]|uniref:hypothetical protein n=1 Tax=Chryseobacterium sp. T16E-39 TaxID=2015076 RepID=UPI000B5B3A17|nr:hypothetical protein [Chryseobacterium sp. T16E-39]ASK31616.1 hypothetical protein CEY12_16515 [Chryseobacterium sp. T16E-39]